MKTAQHKTSVPPQIGDRMPDSTIYAGSLDGEDLYTTPADAPLIYTFNDAAKYAELLNAEKFLGHDDWRLPTKAELNVLFNNRAAIGGFAVRGSDRAWYWSSTSADSYMLWQQNFLTGSKDWNNWDYHGETRVVRVFHQEATETCKGQSTIENDVTTAKDGLPKTITVSKPFRIKKPPL